MKKYRLKKEAVPFFNEHLATSILDWDVWMDYKVDAKALEEVKPIYIQYGHYSSKNETSSTLSGWNVDGQTFHFTIHFPDCKYIEHDKFSNGRIVRDMMNKIQSIMDNYFSDFVNNLKEN